MSRRDKYSPDYSKLYSGVHIAPDVMRVLTGSDRKMRYCEYDLKTERVRKNTRTKATMVYPAREDSLDRLSEENNRHYALEVDSPEDLVAAQDEIIRLKQALWKLKPDEWELINLLYYKEMSEAEAGKMLGLSQQGISKRLKRIYRNLKKILGN